MNTCRHSDEELVRYYLATQNSEYFGQLYKRYAPKVFRRCLTITRDPINAEDYTQDIFVRVLSSLTNFREKSSFSTWLYTISSNYCMDRMKTSRKQTWVELDHEISKTLADTNESDALEARYQVVDYVMEKISSSESRYLRMKYEENLNIREMARLLKVKDSAVKMRLKRVRDKVKDILYYHQFD
ncbi:RNA polymerase sigma factor [Larkinella soli]|uniref:RNA polymerase sigma factor n=1 Tax=Larkinella soli TaxID=1770527 RepID=UPI000FFC2931|nr:sigma-70 family RNA polymerase sigma factor [Larkinella soli]